jgi:poly(3-hydroxybutyrate) depolymerase
VGGELDDISGSGQTEAAHKLCSGIVRKEQHHLEVKGAGHYGIFSGRRWREVVYPHVKSFILENNKGEGKLTALSKTKVVAKKAAPVAKKAAPVKSVANPAVKKAANSKK